jgi:transcriptional regulator with XRE-family HTH domain
VRVGYRTGEEVEVTEVRKTAEPVGELVRWLCQLKDESGRSLRELERATHASNSALSRYLSGQASPPWTVVVALCREAGRDPRPLRQLWEEACEARRLRGTAASGTGGGKAVRGKAASARENAAEVRPHGRNDLPRDTPAFTARDAELAELTRLARAGCAVAVDGMGGAGKTALALHAAHMLAGEFGDCQVFLDLHGFTPGREPLTPEEALRRLLGALDVPESRIPAGTEERAALWRAELADRKAVVVLDNARDADQLRPLMPGAGAHAVLITSRRRLVELDGVEPLTVGGLAPHEAAEMFTRILDAGNAGERRHDADPQAVDNVMARCSHHPLAIRMTAARLKHRPQWSRSISDLDTLPREVVAALREIRESTLAVLSPLHRALYTAMLDHVAGGPSAEPEAGARPAAEITGLDERDREETELEEAGGAAAAAQLHEDLVDMHLVEIADPEDAREDAAAGQRRYRLAYGRLMHATR